MLLKSHGGLIKMSTVNTTIATGPYLPKFDNSAVSNDVKFDKKIFDRIDSKAATESGDTVNFSSRAQFLFNLQTYSHTLADEERNQFADGIAQSGDEIFDENFVQHIRDSPFTKEGIFRIDPETREKMESSIIGKEGFVHQELTVLYSGPTLIGQWNFHKISGSGDIHETDHLTNQLDQLTSKAAKKLSKQDLATMTGTMGRAIDASRNDLNSSYALFRTNYDYEVAEQAISKLPMSDGLKEEFSNLLSEVRSFQNQRNSDYIDQQEIKIQNYPQFEGIIKEEIQALKEGLEINTELQQSISHSQNGLFGVENYFQILIKNSESIEGESSENISDMFNHFTDQVSEFNRIFIEKDWGTARNKKEVTRDPVMDTAVEETQELTNQYIVAINSYMANQNTSNT